MNIHKALIVAAHPDDDILGCGGLLSRFRGEIQFKVVFIAEGTSARFDNNYSSDCIAEINHRTKCAQDALSYLGVENISVNNLKCCSLDTVGHLEVNKIIEKEIPLSNKIGSGGTKPDDSWKIEESKNWTIAPAYNKGPYMVVAKEDIKTAGRKV